jgi:hypothetical protein
MNNISCVCKAVRPATEIGTVYFQKLLCRCDRLYLFCKQLANIGEGLEIPLRSLMSFRKKYEQPQRYRLGRRCGKGRVARWSPFPHRSEDEPERPPAKGMLSVMEACVVAL